MLWSDNLYATNETKIYQLTMKGRQLNLADYVGVPFVYEKRAL